MPDQSEITDLLRELERGRDGAMDRLIARVYDDLRGIARHRLNVAFERGGREITLDPSDLVHETYLRLIRQRKRYDNKGHFFAIATRVMMRVLGDYERGKNAEKRFGGQLRVSLSGLGAEAADSPDPAVSDFADAIDRLEALDARGAEIVKLRALWGLTITEIADTLGVSRSTVDREWKFSRRWLAVELGGRT